MSFELEQAWDRLNDDYQKASLKLKLDTQEIQRRLDQWYETSLIGLLSQQDDLIL